MRQLFATIVVFVVIVAACSSAGEDVSPPTATRGRRDRHC